MKKTYISTTILAKILGVSRVTVFKRVQKGEIKAQKVGPTWVINKKDLPLSIRFKKHKIRWPRYEAQKY